MSINLEQGITHPIDIAGMKRIMRWTDLEDNKTYTVEILCWHHIQIRRFRKGAYYDCVVLFKDDPAMDENEIVLLGLAGRTLINALRLLPPAERKPVQKQNMTEFQSVKLKFTKNGQKRMTIHEIKPLPVNEQFKIEALKMYSEQW